MDGHAVRLSWVVLFKTLGKWTIPREQYHWHLEDRILHFGQQDHLIKSLFKNSAPQDVNIGINKVKQVSLLWTVRSLSCLHEYCGLLSKDMVIQLSQTYRKHFFLDLSINSSQLFLQYLLVNHCVSFSYYSLDIPHQGVFGQQKLSRAWEFSNL